MDRYDCFKNREELIVLKNRKIEKLKLLRSKQGLKAVVYDKDRVQGGKKHNFNEELSLQICQIELDIIAICKEIEIEDKYIEQLKAINDAYNDNSLYIMQLKAKGLSNKEISIELKCGVATIQRKLKNINKMIEK